MLKPVPWTPKRRAICERAVAAASMKDNRMPVVRFVLPVTVSDRINTENIKPPDKPETSPFGECYRKPETFERVDGSTFRAFRFRYGDDEFYVSKTGQLYEKET